MKKINNMDYEVSSVNVFADLELRNADKLLIKSGLMVEIANVVQKRRLTQEQAAQIMGINQAKVSKIINGIYSDISERKLIDCLNRIGYDVEISVKPSASVIGHLVVSA